jgi:hypothetical protein
MSTVNNENWTAAPKYQGDWSVLNLFHALAHDGELAKALWADKAPWTREKIFQQYGVPEEYTHLFVPTTPRQMNKDDIAKIFSASLEQWKEAPAWTW